MPYAFIEYWHLSNRASNTVTTMGMKQLQTSKFLGTMILLKLYFRLSPKNNY